MKNVLTTAIVMLTCCVTFAKEPKNPLMDSETVVWVGLDYSLVRIIGGSKGPYDFTVPDLIFPGMMEKWNQLFLEERDERVAHALGKRVSIDLSGITERNQTASVSQITLTPGDDDVIEKTHIPLTKIASEVQSYKLKTSNGLGLVFIVDRLVSTKIAQQFAHDAPRERNGGALYIVFFDIATRNVVSSERVVRYVSSAGNFRNFWFGPIKDSDSKLSKYSSSSVPPQSRTGKQGR